MGLQLDRSFGKERQLAVPIVFHDGVVDHQLVVQPDGGASAHLPDAQVVPFAEGFIGQHQGIFARCAGAVVPQAAGAFVGAQIPFAAGFRVIPDLDLRCAAQVNAAVRLGYGLVIDEQFDVAVIFFGGGVGALAIVDQDAVFDLPVFLEGLLVLVISLFRDVLDFAWIEMRQAVPAIKILAVEQGGETRRGRNISTVSGECCAGRQSQGRESNG